MLFVLRIVYRTKIHTGWKIALGVLWFISLASLGGIAGKLVKAHAADANITTKTPIPVFPFDTLVVDFTTDDGDYLINIDNAIKISESTLAIEGVSVSVLESDDEHFKWGSSLSAKGINPEVAADHAEQIEFDLQLLDNHLILPKYIYLKEGQKWHSQEVFVTIWVPVGKYIWLPKDALQHHVNITVKGDAHELWHAKSDLWRMEQGGLVNVQ